MHILISATSRSGKRFQGRGVEGDGCIYVCHYDQKRHTLNPEKRIYLPKPLLIGRQHRLGARGIAKLPNGKIVCANHDSLFLLDGNFNISKGISLPSMGDIHDIVIDPTKPQICVTCSSSDSIQYFNFNLEHQGSWRACNQPALAKFMNQKHLLKKNVPVRFHNRKNFLLHDYRKSFNGDVFHLNSVFWWKDKTLTTFSTLAKVFNITDNEFIDLPFRIKNKLRKGGRIHGGIVDQDILTILNTHYGAIERYNLQSPSLVSRISIHNTLKPTPLKQIGFLRGITRLSKDEYLVGQIGPSIYYCNFMTKEIKQIANFENSDQWSAYNICRV